MTERSFLIKYGSVLSDMAAINAGVPQGGISSPVLHYVFVSDQSTTPNTPVADYADDEVVITSINTDPLVASNNQQNHLDYTESWFT